MKRILALLIALLLLLLGLMGWVLMSFHIIDGQLYSKTAQSLDLRTKTIPVSHYEALAQRMPECEILWNVPFQGSYYSSDSRELALKDLTTDLEALAYFPRLQTLDARHCHDLSGLAVLRGLYPELKILAEVTLDGNTYGWDAEEVTLSSIKEEELALLPCLTELKQVTVCDGGDAAKFAALQEYCLSRGIGFEIRLAGEAVTEETRELTISGVTDNQVQLIAMMPWMKTLHFPEPQAPAEMLLSLRQQLPQTEITWEKTVLGVTFRDNVRQVDLTDVISRAEGEAPDAQSAYAYNLARPVMGDREEVQSSVNVADDHPLPDKTGETAALLAELEAAMSYFPEAEQLTLVGAWLDNEAMGAFREAHRQDYKVVWTVQCGRLATRTDAKIFMPTKYFVTAGSFADWHTENLKYCEEMVSMDLGHMSLSELDFLRYMPDLTYLDIALNHLSDLSPLAECKNLVFLVMHSLSLELDYTPLQQCTALEDLNISDNPGDISSVFEMTWLKNLWITDLGHDTYAQAKAALPDTNIGYYYDNPNSGWRSLPNYYKMRDSLLMFYMS